jgi:hypothetical protein
MLALRRYGESMKRGNEAWPGQSPLSYDGPGRSFPAAQT